MTLDVGPLAKVQFRDQNKYRKVKELFVAVEGISTGQFVYCGKTAQLQIGNVMPIGKMPEGMCISFTA